MRDTRRTRLVLAVLLLTALTLITIDIRGGDGSPLSGLRSAGQTLLGPVERAASAVVRPVADFIAGIGSIGSNRRRISELEQRNQALEQQLRTSDLARARSDELDRLLHLAGLGRYRIVPAQVIAIGPAQGFTWTVTVDAGTGDGVRRDQTVLNGDGLVGRVVEVGPSTATVLLAIDPTSVIGARLSPTLEMGAVSGRGRDPMTLELFDPQATVTKGDRLVTLGSRDQTPWVWGVPIGEVSKVVSTPGALSRTAYVRPYVDFSALDLVGIVVQPPRTNPRDAVLPPLPTPTATPTPTPSGSGTATAPSASGSPSASPSPS